MSDAAEKREPTSGWLTSKEAALMLKMTVSGVKSLVERGRLVPDYRGGLAGRLRGHRFRVETIEAFLRSGGDNV